MAAVAALVSWNRMIPPPTASRRETTNRSSWPGAIGFQSLAHRSAPNTTIRRWARRWSRAGVEAKPGKRKERRRAAGGLTGRRLDRGDAAIDLALGGREGTPVEQRVREGVARDRVALGAFAPHERRSGLNVSADEEEGRLHAFALERVEHPIRGAGPRAVVEGEHDLFGRERQRGGKLLASDPRRCRGVDRQHAAGAERAGIARALRRERLRRDQRDQHKDDRAGQRPAVLMLCFICVP